MDTERTRPLEPEEKDKAAAKAEKARAEAEKARAEAEKASAEAWRARGEASEAEAKAAVAVLAREREEEKRERERLADDFRYGQYHFTGTVDPGSVAKCIGQLKQWHRQDPTMAIELIFSSPGGGVIAGMELFDFLLQLRRLGHPLTTVAMGMAASMAGILLQAGDVRAIGREAYVLIHEVSTLTGGSMGEIEDEVEFLHKMQRRILGIFAERTQATNAPKKLTLGQLKRRWRRKNWWIDSAEALEFGLVDEIR